MTTYNVNGHKVEAYYNGLTEYCIDDKVTTWAIMDVAKVCGTTIRDVIKTFEEGVE